MPATREQTAQKPDAICPHRTILPLPQRPTAAVVVLSGILFGCIHNYIAMQYSYSTQHTRNLPTEPSEGIIIASHVGIVTAAPCSD